MVRHGHLFWFRASQDQDHHISPGEAFLSKVSCDTLLLQIWARLWLYRGPSEEMAEGNSCQKWWVFIVECRCFGISWPSTFVKLMSLNHETICLRVKLAFIISSISYFTSELEETWGEFLQWGGEQLVCSMLSTPFLPSKTYLLNGWTLNLSFLDANPY